MKHEEGIKRKQPPEDCGAKWCLNSNTRCIPMMDARQPTVALPFPQVPQSSGSSAIVAG